VKRGRERELKLSASPSLRIPPLDGIADGVSAVAREPVRLLATYLDTDDLRLARAGVTLRHRTAEGWTLKLPAGDDGSFLVRCEFVFPGDVRHPPAEAVDLVRAYTRSAALGTQARLRTVRRVVELRNGDGSLAAEVSDDEVSVLDGRRVAARFRELEVELQPVAPESLAFRVAEALQEAGAGAPEQTPKLVRALGSRAEEPPDVMVPAASGATAGDVVRRALASSVARLVVHDPVTRLDADREGVHQMRVATRRLRSDLRTFGAVVDADWSRELRGDLGRLAGLLGAVRDADVLLERFRSRAGSVVGAEPVLAALATQRAEAFTELMGELRGEEYAQLLDRLVEAAREPALTPAAAERARDVLPGQARSRWRALAKAARKLGDDPSAEELHDVRIRVKRCRYAVEAVEPTLGKGAAAFARGLARLQDRLGELNDASVAEAWLREWVRQRRGAAVFAAGELAGLELAEAAASRRGWRKAWKSAAASVPTALR